MCLCATPWAQEVGWVYIRRSDEFSDDLWASCVLSTYVLCRGSQNFSLSYLLKVDLDLPCI